MPGSPSCLYRTAGTAARVQRPPAGATPAWLQDDRHKQGAPSAARSAARRAAPPGAKTPPAARCAARQPAAPQGNAPRRLPPRDDRPLQAGGGCSQQAFRFTTAHEGREHEKSALAARVPLAGDRGQPPGVQGTGQRPQVTEPFARHHTPGGDTEARTDAWWPAVALRPPGAWPLPCRGARKRARSHRARGASGRPRR